jgi:uncharacterized protein (TIRG00374 family)
MKMRIALTLVLTLACLGWVLAGVDPSRAAATLRTMGWTWLAPVMGLYLLAHALRVARFLLLLDPGPGARPSAWRTFSIVSVGYLAIHVVPLRMGEFVRPWLLRERAGVPFGAGLAAIVLERILDMGMLLAMLLCVGAWVDLPSGVVVNGVDVLASGQRAATVLVALGIAGLVAVAGLGERVLTRTDRLPAGGMVRRFAEAVHALAARPMSALAALALSIAIWAVTIGAVRVAMTAFPGIPTGWSDALTTWALTLAGMTAVPTPGFFGGYEAACTTVLGMLGTDATAAGTFAILLHLGQFAFTVVLGVACLLHEGLNLGSVVARSRTATDEATAP